MKTDAQQQRYAAVQMAHAIALRPADVQQMQQCPAIGAEARSRGANRWEEYLCELLFAHGVQHIDTPL